MPVSKLTSKGQTTIPKEIRDALDLKPGDRILFMISDDGKVTMTPQNKGIEELAGIFYDPDRKPLTDAELKEAVAQAAVERYLRSS